MNNPNTKSDSWAARNTKNTLIIFYWTAAWVLTTALVTFGTEFIWQSNKLYTSLAILVNVVIGFGMILAVKRYLDVTHIYRGNNRRTQEVPMKNRLKVLRAERDWTQAQLAVELEVSRQTVNAIEKGKFDPSLPLAFKAARLFGLSIEDIFQDEAGS
jgi:putative transcriptional regulator